MQGCFLGIDQIKLNNNSDKLGKIKCILHKYIYSDQKSILELECKFADCFNEANIFFKPDDNSFIIKMSKNLKKDIVKQCKKMNFDVSDNTFFYNFLSGAFVEFLLSKRDIFLLSLYKCEDLYDEDKNKIYNDYLRLAEDPFAIRELTHIVSMMENDNYIIVQI